MTDIYLLSVKRLASMWKPLRAWCEPSITRNDIAQAISTGAVEPQHRSEINFRGIIPRSYHIQRIAYFVLNPDPTPISVDVGCPSLPGSRMISDIYVDDGNHRLAAAEFRGDETIAVDYSGEVARFHELFPEAVVQKLDSAVIPT